MILERGSRALERYVIGELLAEGAYALKRSRPNLGVGSGTYSGTTSPVPVIVTGNQTPSPMFALTA